MTDHPLAISPAIVADPKAANPPGAVLVCGSRRDADAIARDMRENGERARVVSRTLSVGGASCVLWCVAGYGQRRKVTS